MQLACKKNGWRQQNVKANQCDRLAATIDWGNSTLGVYQAASVSQPNCVSLVVYVSTFKHLNIQISKHLGIKIYFMCLLGVSRSWGDTIWKHWNRKAYLEVFQQETWMWRILQFLPASNTSSQSFAQYVWSPLSWIFKTLRWDNVYFHWLHSWPFSWICKMPGYSSA